MNRVRVLLAALLLSAVSNAPCRGAEIAGVGFPDHREVADVTLDLNCVGLLNYGYFFKVYAGALYLGRGVSPRDAAGDVPKRLELSYFRSIAGSAFGPAGDQILAKNVAPETLDSLRSRLDRLNAAYESVKPGDRYSLSYLPGVGTELALNGQPRILIPGADFAAAYFRIWLGEHPIDGGFRDQLLDCSNTTGRRSVGPSSAPAAQAPTGEGTPRNS